MLPHQFGLFRPCWSALNWRVSGTPRDGRKYASPTDRNYLRYAKFADLDTLIYLRTRFAQLAPSVTVRAVAGDQHDLGWAGHHLSHARFVRQVDPRGVEPVGCEFVEASPVASRGRHGGGIDAAGDQTLQQMTTQPARRTEDQQLRIRHDRAG